MTIHWNMIDKSLVEDNIPTRFHNKTKENFQICSNCTALGPYDFSSVMHYPEKMGIQNRVIITVNENKCKDCVIGQREGLSAQDISDIYELYGCRK